MSNRRSALAELEGLRAAIPAAQARIEELKAGLRSAERIVEKARGPLATYYSDVEAGVRKASKSEEEKLRTAVDEAGPEQERELRMFEARIEGARRVLIDTQSAVPHFVVDNREQLMADLIAQSEEARDGLLAAWDQMQAAAGRWSQTRATWSQLIERWEISPLELPVNPASDLVALERAFAPMASGELRDPRRLWPMPASLVPGDWPEVEVSDDSMKGSAGSLPSRNAVMGTLSSRRRVT